MDVVDRRGSGLKGGRASRAGRVLGPGGVGSPSGGVLALPCPSRMTLDESLNFAEPQGLHYEMGLTGSPGLCQRWEGG